MEKATSKGRRPVYLNLFKIRLPIAGVVSLAHRGSGVLMFLAMPFIVYLLDLSVQSGESFEQAVSILQHPVLVVVQILFIWALAHHLFAGIRFLLIDADIGIEKKPASMAAWLVMLLTASVVIVALIGMLL
ncbi:MAG: succinate dehydrogenase, cytochrome b556 subunit [Gammaproteobacteria bacterium]|nr:succinate dehydrogenase, cytochrome b556 subunit [Gammaproteobacteria bacterium]